MTTQARQPEPGFNPLFAGVVFDLAAALAVAVFAGGGEILDSNLIYRMTVGGIAFALAYAATVALWLAWHHKAYKKLGMTGANIETPNGESNAQEIRDRDLEVAEFMGTTTNAVEELRRRVEALEQHDR